MAYDDPAELWKRLQVQAAQGVGDVDLEYQLRNLGMFRAWQDSSEGNLNDAYPLNLDVYIPPYTKHIKNVTLRMRLRPYEYYVRKATTLDGTFAGQTFNANWDIAFETGVQMSDEGNHSHTVTVSSNGIHDHAGAVGADGSHTHTASTNTDGSHLHTMNKHTHIFDTPPHDHFMEPFLVTWTYATNVQVWINGTDRTSALGGPFTTDQAALDITQYMTATGWNIVEFKLPPGGHGRIRASFFCELYVKN